MSPLTPTSLFAWTEEYENFDELDEAVIAGAIQECIGKFTERPKSRFLLGVYGSAFVAWGATYHYPDKYAGAVALYPTVQAAQSVPLEFERGTPNDLREQQRYNIYCDSQRWRSRMDNSLANLARSASENVVLAYDPVEDLEFLKAVDADSNLAKRMAEELRNVINSN